MNSVKSKRKAVAEPMQLKEKEDVAKGLAQVSPIHNRLGFFRHISHCCKHVSSAMETVSNRTTLVTPPALLPMTNTTIEVQILGVKDEFSTKLIVHQKSNILVQRQLNASEISTGKIIVEMPAMSEGTVTFLLMSENLESETMLHSTPCCLVPSLVISDIEKMFSVMCSVASDCSEMPKYVRDEQTKMVWVWREHFCQFLRDVDLVFEWLESTESISAMIMDVFTSMLQQTCQYEAWEFAAYIICKAIKRGVKICPDSLLGANKQITAQTLKEATSMQHGPCTK